MSTPPSIFTAHAVQRMTERCFTPEQVWATMTNPEVVHPDKHGNTCYMAQVEDGRWMRVVVSATSRRIVTVVDTDEDRR